MSDFLFEGISSPKNFAPAELLRMTSRPGTPALSLEGASETIDELARLSTAMLADDGEATVRHLPTQ
jgi:hypothetical protein